MFRVYCACNCSFKLKRFISNSFFLDGLYTWDDDANKKYFISLFLILFRIFKSLIEDTVLTKFVFF